MSMAINFNDIKNMGIKNFKLLINLTNICKLESISNIDIDLKKLINRVGLITLQKICSDIYDIQTDYPKCDYCNLRICNCNTNLYHYHNDKINPIHISSEGGILNFLESVIDELKNPYDDNVYGLLILEIKLLEMGILVDTNIYRYPLYNRNDPWIVNNINIRLSNIRYITNDYALNKFMVLWDIPKTNNIQKNIISIIKMEYSIIQFLVKRELLKSYWLDVFDCNFLHDNDTDIFVIEL